MVMVPRSQTNRFVELLIPVFHRAEACGRSPDAPKLPPRLLPRLDFIFKLLYCSVVETSRPRQHMLLSNTLGHAHALT